MDGYMDDDLILNGQNSESWHLWPVNDTEYLYIDDADDNSTERIAL